MRIVLAQVELVKALKLILVGAEEALAQDELLRAPHQIDRLELLADTQHGGEIARQVVDHDACDRNCVQMIAAERSLLNHLLKMRIGPQFKLVFSFFQLFLYWIC